MFGETFHRDLRTSWTLGVLESVLLSPLVPCFLLINRISDSTHLKKRLYFSTVHKEFSATPLHARIPFVSLKQNIVSIQPIPSTPHIRPSGSQQIPQKSNKTKTVFLFVWLQPLPHNKTLSCFLTTNVMLPLFSQWSNLCIDLVSFTAELFKTAVFRTLDSIAVCANCKIRRIFTMKTEATDTSDGGGKCGGMANGDSKTLQCMQHMCLVILNVAPQTPSPCGHHDRHLAVYCRRSPWLPTLNTPRSDLERNLQEAKRI